jgi:hypothetical protein
MTHRRRPCGRMQDADPVHCPYWVASGTRAQAVGLRPLLRGILGLHTWAEGAGALVLGVQLRDAARDAGWCRWSACHCRAASCMPQPPLLACACALLWAWRAGHLPHRTPCGLTASPAAVLACQRPVRGKHGTYCGFPGEAVWRSAWQPVSHYLLGMAFYGLLVQAFYGLLVQACTGAGPSWWTGLRWAQLHICG